MKRLIVPSLAAVLAWTSFSLLAGRDDCDDQATALAGRPAAESESAPAAKLGFAAQAAAGAALLQLAFTRRQRAH